MKLPTKKKLVAKQKLKKGKHELKTGKDKLRKGKKPKKAVELSTLSVDDFMGQDLSASETDGELEFEGNESEQEEKKGKVSDDEIEADDDDNSVVLDARSHKKSLQKLRDLDPEFYQYLSQNDKSLLEFSASEDEADDEPEDEEKFHKPPNKLEVGSDESDYEAGSDTEEKDSRVITLKMVNKWQEQLQTDKTVQTIKTVVKAFHAALLRVSPDDEERDTARYKVDGSSVFNAVIQLCVLELQPALKRFLKLPASSSSSVPPFKCKRWPKVKSIVKFYLRNLLKLLSGVSSPQIVAVLLKHLHQMMPFLACYTQMTRPLLKKLVHFWSGGEETVRVVAFLCLLRITTGQQKEFLDKVLKMMYLAYVSNCKFVSPSTLPAINFMRRSLTEMFTLDLNISYQLMFLYIRQLAIHLRNAITLQKKETIQAVYNWQFVHSLHLWSDVLGATVNKPQLQPLIYPVVQIITGTIKLIPTAQYYPLRFHCVQILIQLSKNTGTYIPILPFLLEVLNTFDFNKAHSKVSMKPLDFTFVLRLSKSQLQENGFKDAVVEKIYQQLLEHLANESNKISFPDVIVPTSIQLKSFLKKCKVSNHCKKMRQVLEKIEENAQAVLKERSQVSFPLNDHKAIDAWETNLKLSGTPLSKFYESWSKVHAQQQAKKMTQNDTLGDFNLPTLKKRDKTAPSPKSEGPVELFPSDESDNDDMFGSEEPKKKRGKRGGKGKNKSTKKSPQKVDNDPEDEDVVEDLHLSDLE